MQTQTDPPVDAEALALARCYRLLLRKAREAAAKRAKESSSVDEEPAVQQEGETAVETDTMQQ